MFVYNLIFWLWNLTSFERVITHTVKMLRCFNKSKTNCSTSNASETNTFLSMLFCFFVLVTKIHKIFQVQPPCWNLVSLISASSSGLKSSLFWWYRTQSVTEWERPFTLQPKFKLETLLQELSDVFARTGGDVRWYTWYRFIKHFNGQQNPFRLVFWTLKKKILSLFLASDF